MKKKKIALVGTYLPRKCGIAAFSSDLYHAMCNDENECCVIAIDDEEQDYRYPTEVRFQIRQNIIKDYISASEFLNINQIDVVCLQHEFGIFGGEHGRFILQFIKRLNAPLITTLHTVLDDPPEDQKEVLKEIAAYSEKIIVMSEKGKQMLCKIYGIDSSKIEVIGHGIPDITKFRLKNYRKELGIKNRKVLLTFGLLSKSKGIETVIRALPEITRRHPDVVYIILGASHPHVIRDEGEDYRNSLMMMVHKLNLDQNVLFIDRFVSQEELFGFLQASDIYIIPYLSKKQVTSGTLVYAMAAGNAVVSTPFWHAEEALTNGRGVFFDFQDSETLSAIVNKLLEEEGTRKSYQNKAVEFAKEYVWENVGKQYISLFGKTRKKKQLQINRLKEGQKIYPEVNLNHFFNLTDDTGILQHARYNVPNRGHGYCLDDNVRAILVMVLLRKKMGDNQKFQHLLNLFLSFVDHAYNPQNRKFRNFMSYDRQWLEESGSEDSQGRAMWAIGTLFAATRNPNTRDYLENLLKYCFEIIDQLTHPRAIAYSLLGFCEFYKKEGDKKAEFNGQLQNMANKLYHYFRRGGDRNWPWPDETVTYDNCRVPQALLASGVQLGDEKLTEKGIRLLDWLISHQFEKGYFSPVGNRNWLTAGHKSDFDQQPIEAAGMIDSCVCAWQITRGRKYYDYARITFNWFLGENSAGIALYDFSTGGCRDGLNRNGLNKNQGAESTLAWLSSLLTMKLL